MSKEKRYDKVTASKKARNCYCLKFFLAVAVNAFLIFSCYSDLVSKERNKGLDNFNYALIQDYTILKGNKISSYDLVKTDCKYYTIDDSKRTINFTVDRTGADNEHHFKFN